MGDIAEMMLDGTLCSSCGDLMEISAGIPSLCSDCDLDAQASNSPRRKMGKSTKNLLMRMARQDKPVFMFGGKIWSLHRRGYAQRAARYLDHWTLTEDGKQAAKRLEAAHA